MTAPETDSSPADPPPAPASPPPSAPTVPPTPPPVESPTASAADPLRRMPLARRWRMWWAVGAVAVIGVYILVAVAYAADSRSVDANYTSSRVGSAEIVVTLTPLAVDAATPRMTLQVEVDATNSGLINENRALTRDLTVEVLPAGGASLDFVAGRAPDSRTVSVPMTGDIENWPFDTYDTDITVEAQVTGDTGEVEYPQVAVRVGGVVQGWSGTAGSVGADELSPDAAADGTHLHFARALAIKLFAGVLIVLLIMMPVLLLAGAVPLYREERLFEAGFLGYAAAMLFAAVPLRNFFPGNPPPGSWVDVLVVLWVLVALIVGIGISVLAFLRHPRRP